MKDTKDQILETALEMFLNKNYEAVTFREICNNTKLTKGALYHYFKSKEELFKAVIDKYIIQAKALVPQECSSLREIIDYTVEEIIVRRKKHDILNSDQLKEKTQQIMNLIIAAYRYYPGFESLGNEMLNSRIDLWKKVLKEAVKNKEIRGDIDIDTIAFTFFSIGSNIVLGLMSSTCQDVLSRTKKQMNEMYKHLKI